MSDGSPDEDPERQANLEQILAEYLYSIERKQPLDQSALVLAHPDLAGDLRSFFRNRESMDRLANAVAETPTLVGISEPGFAAGAVTVRYFGDYELLDEIARGGMGIVYKARQVNLNRIVALKMILAGQLANDNDVKRFCAEAEAAARLDHPGIVPIYEIGQHEGQHYFSMAYVEGISLAKKVADGPLQPRDAAEMVRKVAVAVEYAHEKGIIHRDLKPANVLLDPSGQPRVTDFGLAKQLKGDSGLTGTGQILGTPSYMPPEQAAGKVDQAGPQSDVYALGAILYCLITGRPPFLAASQMDTLLQVLEKEPVSPRQLSPQVPIDLETMCMKCLEKEPRRRYASARDLADELQRFLNGEPIQARPSTKLERATKWARRRPAIAGLSVAIFLLTVFGLTGILSQWRRAVSAEVAERSHRARAEKLLAESNAYLYISQINLANGERTSGDIQRADETLDGCDPSLRHWEWNYLRRQCHPELVCIDQSARSPYLAISPDGQTIAIPGDRDMEIGLKLIDANTGEQRSWLGGHKNWVTVLAFSPDGNWLVSGGGHWQNSEAELRLWNLKSNQQVLSFQGHADAITTVAFHPSSLKLASGDRKGVVKLWNVPSGDEIGTYSVSCPPVTAMAFQPSGGKLAISEGKSEANTVVRIWDISQGKPEMTLHGFPNHAEVFGLAFSPDGRYVAAGDVNNTVVICDAASGTAKRTLYHAGRKVAFSPDGKYLASTDALTTQIVKSTKLWEIETERQARTIYGAFGEIAFFPDGSRIATASFQNTIKVWDVINDQEAKRLPIANNFEPIAMAFSPDSQHIVVGDDSTTFTLKTPDSISSSNKKTISLWETATRQKQWHTIVTEGDYRIHATAFAPNGRWFTTVQSWNGSETDPPCMVTVHNAMNGEPKWTISRPPADRLVALAISPDGERIAFGGHRESVEICQSSDGSRIAVIPSCGMSVAFHPSGRWLATASSVLSDEVGKIQLWDTTTGAHVRTFDLPKKTKMVFNALQFSPNGKYLAATSGFYTDYPNLVTLWDSASGEEVFVLSGHADVVKSLSFSPDSRRLVSGSKDETLIVWDVVFGKRVLTLPSHVGAVINVAFSPDGNYIAVAGTDGLCLFDGSGADRQ